MDLSVVVPVHNEEGSLGELNRRLIDTLACMRLPFEIVYVDDGSTDGSLALLRGFARDPAVRVLALSRNFGHQAALAAGLEHAEGVAVVTMDADLQDPPELIPALVAQWRSGHEVVAAQRIAREGEQLVRRIAIKLYYRLLRRISDHPVMVDVGDYRLLDRRVLDIVVALPEREKYLRGLVSWAGFSHAMVPYTRPARFSGRSKFTYRRLLALAMRGVASSSKAPLHAIVALGAGAFTVGGALSAYALATNTARWSPVSWIATTLLLAGVQLAALGFVAIYVGRILDEVRERPMYLVAWDSDWNAASSDDARVVNSCS